MRLRRKGAAWAVIARETGLEVRKLQRWSGRAGPSAPVPVLRPVEVVPPGPTDSELPIPAKPRDVMGQDVGQHSDDLIGNDFVDS